VAAEERQLSHKFTPGLPAHPATYHAWKRKFGGMEVSEAKRLRGLEEENSRLKRLVADQAVQIHILKEVNAKKW
jgi:putative transposase